MWKSKCISESKKEIKRLALVTSAPDNVLCVGLPINEAASFEMANEN